MQTGVQQALQVVLGHVVHHTQLQVGQRAHRERGAFARQALHQGRVVFGLHAVVDAFHLQHIERAVDIGRRTFLAGVGHGVQAQRAGAGEHVCELLGWVAQFARIQAHPDEAVAPGQGGVECGLGLGFAQVAQKTQDEFGAQVQLALRALAGAVQSLDDRAHGHAARRVGLWVEEDFGAHHTVGRRPLQIGPSQVVEIGFGAQHRSARVIDVQKTLQIAEGVSGAHRVHVGIWQAHAIALGQGEHQLRLQRAFDVQVQLRFGQGAQPVAQGLGRQGGQKGVVAQGHRRSVGRCLAARHTPAPMRRIPVRSVVGRVLHGLTNLYILPGV